jgi:hypothetical protein
VQNTFFPEAPGNLSVAFDTRTVSVPVLIPRARGLVHIILLDHNVFFRRTVTVEESRLLNKYQMSVV